MILSFPPNDLHLWYVFSEEITSCYLLDSYVNLLSVDERSRYLSFRCPRRRHEYLVTRALVRTTLSKYTKVPPQDLIFRNNSFCRPELAKPDGMSLKFNVSHSNGLIVFAVMKDSEVGVDVETIKRNIDVLDIAETFFSPEENKVLNKLPVDKRLQKFLEYWTLKEAYVKACGIGLSIPIDKVQFKLEPEQPIQAFIDPSLNDDATKWSFVQLDLNDEYIGAAAVRHTHTSLTVRDAFPIRTLKRHIVPLV